MSLGDVFAPDIHRALLLIFYCPTDTWSGCPFKSSVIAMVRGVGQTSEGPALAFPDQGLSQSAFQLFALCSCLRHNRQRESSFEKEKHMFILHGSM